MGTNPVETTQLWPDPEHGPWEVTLWWRAQHGKAELVGLEVKSWFDDTERVLYDKAGMQDRGLPRGDADVSLPAIDSKFLKSLPIGRLQDQSRDTVLHAIETGFVEPVGGTQMAEVVDRFRATEHGRGLGLDHYAEVAAVYRKAAAEGRAPTKAVSEHFVVSKSAAAKKVARARERGFLPATTRGRVGPLREEL